MNACIFGIDLSGPSNTKESMLVSFEAENDSLRLTRTIEAATDQAIYYAVTENPDVPNLVVGIDAPLSYNPGGGDRQADKLLRKRIIAKGMHPGSVMVPTLTKMVYLTLRGICVSRFLENHSNENIRIVEIHPSASLALRGASVESIREMKKNVGARQVLLNWLVGQGLKGIDITGPVSDHYVAACAAALAAWKWYLGQSVWIFKSEMPFHPYDFAC